MLDIPSLDGEILTKNVGRNLLDGFLRTEKVLCEGKVELSY